MTTEELTTGFEEIRAQLRGYLLRMTTSSRDADDLVQDTYLKAHKGLAGFRGESSLKTWLFTIASNVAKDHLRAQQRWPENVTDICKEAAMQNRQFFQEAMQIRATSPQGNFEIKEHIAFCYTCVSRSLPLEQQICLWLKEVYGFKVGEIAGIMSQTEAMVKYYLHTGRGKMIDVFDGRCSLINKAGVCHQCTELNGIFNPDQKQAEEVAKIKMARDAEKEDKAHLFDLRMQILQELDPFESGAAELQLHHLEHNRQVMEASLKKK
ncbi:MAG: RNA polymerase sigma factor [Bacteroidota bacterium]